jgi:hypothetical protein
MTQQVVQPRHRIGINQHSPEKSFLYIGHDFIDWVVCKAAMRMKYFSGFFSPAADHICHHRFGKSAAMVDHEIISNTKKQVFRVKHQAIHVKNHSVKPARRIHF